jgi:putative transposase
MDRDMEVTGINQLWVADITYIQLPKEFIYLAVIIDVVAGDVLVGTWIELSTLN